MLTNTGNGSSAETNVNNKIIDACTELVIANLRKKIMNEETDSFNELDEPGKQIVDKLSIQGNRKKLNKLLNEIFDSPASLTTILYGGAKFAPLREALAKEINSQ